MTPILAVYLLFLHQIKRCVLPPTNEGATEKAHKATDGSYVRLRSAGQGSGYGVGLFQSAVR